MPRWSRTSSDGRGSSALNCSKRPPCLPLRPPNRNFVVPDHRHFPSVAMGEPLPLCTPAEKSPRLSTHVHRFHTQISHSSLRVNRNHAYNGQNSPPRSRPSSAEAHWEENFRMDIARCAVWDWSPYAPGHMDKRRRVKISRALSACGAGVPPAGFQGRRDACTTNDFDATPKRGMTEGVAELVKWSNRGASPGGVV